MQQVNSFELKALLAKFENKAPTTYAAKRKLIIVERIGSLYLINIRFSCAISPALPAELTDFNLYEMVGKDLFL